MKKFFLAALLASGLVSCAADPVPFLNESAIWNSGRSEYYAPLAAGVDKTPQRSRAPIGYVLVGVIGELDINSTRRMKDDALAAAYLSVVSERGNLFQLQLLGTIGQLKEFRSRYDYKLSDKSHAVLAIEYRGRGSGPKYFRPDELIPVIRIVVHEKGKFYERTATYEYLEFD